MAKEEELSGWEAFKSSVNPARPLAAPLSDFDLLSRRLDRTAALSPFKIVPHYWPAPPMFSEYPSISGLEVLSQRPHWTYIEEKGPAIWEAQGQAVPAAPEEQVFCVNQLHYTQEGRLDSGEVDFEESVEDVDPAGALWTEVGQHIRFQPEIVRLARDFVEHLFLTNPVHVEPHRFIAVHIRQGDFAESGRAVGTTTLPRQYARAVAVVQQELYKLHGADWEDLPVVFATDSKDRDWVERVEVEYGWVFLDHEAWEREAGEEHSSWLPAVLDSAVLSQAAGLVG